MITQIKRRFTWVSLFNASDKTYDKKFEDCGLHAREWISQATCRYFINEVLQAHADPNYAVKDSLPYNADDLRGLLDFNW